MMLHQKFKKSCNANNIIALIFCGAGVLLFQINHKEIPISKYSSVQTGAKRNAGGFHDGLLSASNHGFIPVLAINPLKIPVLSQIRIAIINFQMDEVLLPAFIIIFL